MLRNLAHNMCETSRSSAQDLYTDLGVAGDAGLYF